MKIAAIDLGTNTFHLIIAEKKGSDFTIIYKTNEPVKLGEDITKDNLIIPAAFDRAISCLKSFKKTLEKYDIDLLKATATSGVRSAINGQEFVKAAKELAGIEINIIDGDEEAQLIYEGVKLSGAIIGKSLIMDIGGGSTEFILCDKENLIWKKSYNIGAARLMQLFFKSDPINETDKNAILKHIDGTLNELISITAIHQPETLIGSAGAFETFASMIDHEVNISEISTTEISLLAYQNLSSNLISSSHKERLVMENLIPLRVDMIVMASLLTNYILQKTQIKKLKLSTYDLKMGVLKSLMN